MGRPQPKAVAERRPGRAPGKRCPPPVPSAAPSPALRFRDATYCRRPGTHGGSALPALWPAGLSALRDGNCPAVVLRSKAGRALGRATVELLLLTMRADRSSPHVLQSRGRDHRSRPSCPVLLAHLHDYKWPGVQSDTNNKLKIYFDSLKACRT